MICQNLEVTSPITASDTMSLYNCFRTIYKSITLTKDSYLELYVNILERVTSWVSDFMEPLWYFSRFHTFNFSLLFFNHRTQKDEERRVPPYCCSKND